MNFLVVHGIDWYVPDWLRKGIRLLHGHGWTSLDFSTLIVVRGRYGFFKENSRCEQTDERVRIAGGCFTVANANFTYSLKRGSDALMTASQPLMNRRTLSRRDASSFRVEIASEIFLVSASADRSMSPTLTLPRPPRWRAMTLPTPPAPMTANIGVGWFEETQVVNVSGE